VVTPSEWSPGRVKNAVKLMEMKGLCYYTKAYARGEVRPVTVQRYAVFYDMAG